MSIILSSVAKLADDTKLGIKVICSENCVKIQKDLSKQINWSDKCLLGEEQNGFRVDRKAVD